ncbi:DUF5712 family protein [Cytophagaceae bacterium YF14B1]|uniref:DUF5712 family protein n=1 Tax=Xanthocytophaga flava TaxID=3048013 RepID=A0AAE3QZA8_9BACT|nr:DUF5712 family protein [Xanthocytophaga flavus]MDJ1485905.1 DUF5712 family protein [Xanthocytophaga flavus]
MISKVLKAKSESKATAKASSKPSAVYDNKGSALRLVNYMEHEALEQGENGKYFSQDRDGVDKEQVVLSIDSNVKGLKKEDSKFYSLIISPSASELAHIGSDEEKLKQYTRQVMENYAANFNLPDGKKLEGKDLVWYGIIHREREYSGTDIQVKEGRVRSGQRKEGDQTHIHIIVSRRDSEQQISLTPTGPRSRFPAQNWQEKNASDFQKMYGFEGKSHFSKDAYKEQKLRERVAAFKEKHQLGGYLSVDRIAFMGKEQGFGKMFYRNLKTLETTLEKGIRPSDPYSGLDRKNLYRQYRIERGYELDSKAERALNRQVVSLRSEYLKEHGVALTELELSTDKIKKAYAGHEHKWKFYQNLSQLKDTILKTGTLPAYYQRRLEMRATTEEIAANKENYRASRKESVREPANGLVNEDSKAEDEIKSQSKEANQKISQEKAEQSFDKSGHGKSDSDKGVEPLEGSNGSSGVSKIAAGLSMLQNILSGMNDGGTGGKEVEWGKMSKKHKKTKEKQNNQEYSL